MIGKHANVILSVQLEIGMRDQKARACIANIIDLILCH